MEFNYVIGCVCDSLTIDGDETRDMNIDDIKTAIHNLIEREQDKAVLQDIISSLIQSQGTLETTDEPCDCCGDFIYTFNLEI